MGIERIRTRDNLTLDWRPQAVWRAKARRIAESRAAFRAAGATRELNATAVAGTFRIPAVLFGFQDTSVGSLPSPQTYDSLYFGLVPPVGRSYSLRTFYREMSNDSLDIQGAAFGWLLGPNPASFYLAACPGGDATDCPTGRSRLYGLWSTALQVLDAAMDLGQFDNDGPDGVPNSGDDDGEVDVVQFTQPVVGGECGGAGIWAHRWFLSALGGSAFVSSDARAGGGAIRVDSYFIASGVGGAGPGNRTGCAQPLQLSGIGTPSHEFGHAIGLPDLYDTSGETQGVGEWGLMGSGGYTSTNSPAHFEAWSKEVLGWVAVRELGAGGNELLEPAITGDTVVLLRPGPATPNPRGEYFLLENRQAIGSDTAGLLVGGGTGPKQGGLLVWHIDATQVLAGGFGNRVNSGPVHGVALLQADNLNHLGVSAGGNRGDAGDPYPGTASNTALSNSSAPAAVMNSDGRFIGFVVDSIRQVVAGGAMAFRLRFGQPLIVTTSGPGAVTSNPLVPSDTLLAPGTVITLAAVAGPGATFDGWSGDTLTGNDTLQLTMDRGWTVEAAFATPLVASFGTPAAGVMGASYSLVPTASGGRGAYAWSLAAGALPGGLTLGGNGIIAGVLEATGQFSFTARVVSGSQSLDLPLTVSVSAPQLTTASVLSVLVGTGGTLSTDDRRYLDLVGNRNGSFDVGDFLAFVRTTGGAVSAATMAELLGKDGGR